MKKEIVDELRALHAEGNLRASAVLARARNVHNPLHDCFEWDNGKAAQQWRLQQAGALIRTVKITTESGSKVRAYYPVRATSSAETAYVPAKDVAESIDLRSNFRRQVSQEICGMVRRWRLHAEFFDLDDILEEIRAVWESGDEQAA